MTIGFKTIPQNLRVPLFYAELDNSHGNTSRTPLRALVIGQITSGGSAAPNVPIISAGPTDARQKGGFGSVLAAMTDAYRAADPFGELWYLPLADAGAAVAATGTVAVTTAPTAVGVVSPRR